MPKDTFAPQYIPTQHPWRRRPAEYAHRNGWYQGGERRRGVKPHYHFIWPKDGKNGSKWGRWKDVMTGKGPDIHLTISADKKDYMNNRQRRSRWSNHMNLDDRGPDGALKCQLPWARRNHLDSAYDFHHRKYMRPHEHMWSDALWQDEPNDDFQFPYAWRNIAGEWWQHEPDAFANW
jgi:hypothetical protein